MKSHINFKPVFINNKVCDCKFNASFTGVCLFTNFKWSVAYFK